MNIRLVQGKRLERTRSMADSDSVCGCVSTILLLLLIESFTY